MTSESRESFRILNVITEKIKKTVFVLRIQFQLFSLIILDQNILNSEKWKWVSVRGYSSPTTLFLDRDDENFIKIACQSTAHIWKVISRR